jgi:altronate hydrolase
VAIAKQELPPGLTLLLTGRGAEPHKLTVQQRIPTGHKIALSHIPSGGIVRRYGHPIGFAVGEIGAGQHVHSHNLEIERDGSRADADSGLGADVRPVAYLPEAERRWFLGYKRGDGRVGTRNYVTVLPSVGCAAHVCREIARHFDPGRLAAQPNIDGVIALTHNGGCCGHPDEILLKRTLAGIARHPNVGGYLLVGLGCEWNLVANLAQEQGLVSPEDAPVAGGPRALVIQDAGGTRQTIQAGIEAIEAMLPHLSTMQRTAEPLSALTLALECGGSDGWSGITANPLVGLVADEVVRQGGTVVLSETPEIYGAEHLLTRRAIRPEVGHKLLAQVQWWEDYTERQGLELDNNPGPGNRAGGISNIYEKSLGAVTKSGSTPLVGVYEYAEHAEAKGLVFMDSPGYDPVSVTGMMAGGCNLVLFTTGRGTVCGSKPAPTVKVCSNSATYARMAEDMDYDAGRALEAGTAMQNLAAELLDLIVAVASGQPSKSEAQGAGEAEFMPWERYGLV